MQMSHADDWIYFCDLHSQHQTRLAIFRQFAHYSQWTLIDWRTHCRLQCIFTVLFLVVQIPLRHLLGFNQWRQIILRAGHFFGKSNSRTAPTAPQLQPNPFAQSMQMCTLASAADNSYQMCWCTEFSEPLWQFSEREKSAIKICQQLINWRPQTHSPTQRVTDRPVPLTLTRQKQRQKKLSITTAEDANIMGSLFSLCYL